MRPDRVSNSRATHGCLPPGALGPYLASLPNMSLAEYFSHGISSGFRVGFDRSEPIGPARGNFPSVQQNPLVVRGYLAAELDQATIRLAGPGESVQVNPIGLIPKSGQPGKFRLIDDLSSPEGRSVNEGIDPVLSSLSYASVDQAVASVCLAGRGAWMAKLDLRSAYRRVPVHPDDQPLLGMAWDDRIFCDRALPFGLRSAPKVFTAVANALAWAMQCEGIGDLIHYLDDFFFWSPATSRDCHTALEIAVPLCNKLGFPVAPHKVVGPATSLIFLGTEIDSLRQEIRLPEDKLSFLKQALRQWGDKRAATKREVQSLIGHLNHAAKVVRPGRPFLRGLIDTMKIQRRQHHRVRLSVACRGDIVWWQRLLEWRVFLSIGSHPSPPVLRRLWALGLRGFCCFIREMVSPLLATVFVGSVNCPQGTSPDRGCPGGLG
uniref:Reverse transcriptase domain-containing protein n=1 Tax=Amphimedon queenslandica TaxID=400682 RepID=A0A1X7U2N6_AMPQE